MRPRSKQPPKRSLVFWVLTGIALIYAFTQFLVGAQITYLVYFGHTRTTLLEHMPAESLAAITPPFLFVTLGLLSVLTLSVGLVSLILKKYKIAKRGLVAFVVFYFIQMVWVKIFPSDFFQAILHDMPKMTLSDLIFIVFLSVLVSGLFYYIHKYERIDMTFKPA